MGNNLKEFSNQEKAMVIIALRDKYPVKRILEVFDMAKVAIAISKTDKKRKIKSIKNKKKRKLKNPFFPKNQL